MSSELVVDVQPKEISIALLENNRLVELQKEARNISFSVGDIYLGRVKKLMPGLNAAFVDVGYEKDAFLHYLDLGTQYNSSARIDKELTFLFKAWYNHPCDFRTQGGEPRCRTSSPLSSA